MTKFFNISDAVAESERRPWVAVGLWGGFLVLLACLSITKNADYDLWWHLNQGRSIWEHGLTFAGDRFSYTFQGMTKFNGEWLSDLIFFGAYQIGGFSGIALLKYVLLLALFVLLYRVGRELYEGDRAWRDPVLFTAMTLVLFAIRFRLFVRPFLFSYIFVALFLWILFRCWRSGDRRWLWWLPVVELFWANTSAGFYFGPFLIAVFIVDAFIKKQVDRGVLLCFFATLAASLVNPEGIQSYNTLFAFVGHGMEADVVGEHQPLSAALLWGYGIGYTWAYQIIVILGVVALGPCGGWRRWPQLILFISFLIPSILIIRMIDFFSLVAMVVTPIALSRIFFWFSKYGNKSLILRFAAPSLAIFMAGSGFLAAFGSTSYAFGIGVVEKKIPKQAVEFLDSEGITGRMFNSYPYGGYIPWASPQRQVYIDGRVNHLYTPAFQANYFKIIHSPAAWAAEEDKWGFEIAVLEYDLVSGGRDFPRHLAENPAWALVYWDDHSAVYLKRCERFAGVIARNEYRVVRPAFNDMGYLSGVLQRLGPAQAIEAAKADVLRNPQHQDPRLALVFLMYSVNRLAFDNDIRRELEICLTLQPDMAIEHSALGTIYFMNGRLDEAARAARKALALDPEDPGGLYLKEKLKL